MEQLNAVQYVYVASSVISGPHPVGYLELRFSEELLSALVLKRKDRPLYRSHACSGDVAVFKSEALCVVGDITEHCLQVFEVEEEKSSVVCNPEDDIQNTRLGIVKSEQTAKKKWPHLGDSCPDRMPVLSEYVPETSRVVFISEIGFRKPESLDPLLHSFAVYSGPAHSCQVALYICKEDRYPKITEGLSHYLKGDRFPCAGCA